MATPVKMPELGESITEGTITRWLKQEGDRVEADEPLFEVSTDKVDTEVPSPVAGVLKSIKVQEDETVEVGAELAVIEPDGEGAAAAEGGEQEAEAGGEAEAEEEAEEEAPAGEQRAEQAAEAEEGEQEAAGGEQRAATAEAEEGEQEAEAEEAPAEEASADRGGDGGGATTVRMPELGESITEGTITRWLKQEGDQVEADEPLFEVSTDKVDTEVPSPVAGTLQTIRVQADETVEVGAELAVIASGGGRQARKAQAEQAERPAEAPAAAERPAEAETPAVEGDGGGRGAVPEGMV
ncbi:MAG TPA: biotin/lipoyl-containing protein, partial [Actinomycetes bacterium]|nr:biotin/lipoyl-containing protein [Actinomycetes bacterium]